MFISIKNHIIFLLIVFTLLPFVLLRIVAEYSYKSAFMSDEKGLVTVATSEEGVGRDISETDFF